MHDMCVCVCVCMVWGRLRNNYKFINCDIHIYINDDFLTKNVHIP